MCDIIREGNYLETAAACCNVNIYTARDWLRVGRKFLKEGISDRIEARFSEAVEKARAESIRYDLRKIADAGEKGAWVANAWRLERRHPEMFGRREKVEVEGAIVATEDRDVVSKMLDQLRNKRRESEDAAPVEYVDLDGDGT